MVHWAFDLTSEPKLHFAWVYDLSLWEGFKVECVSPFPQWSHSSDSSPAEQADTVSHCVLQLAASQCFYRLPRSSLLATERHENIEIDDASDLFDVFWQLIRAILKNDDEELLEVMSMRKYATQGDDMFKQLMEVPEVADLLTKDDQ